MELSGLTDKGLKRTNNEDSFVISKKWKYIILADGMGGHLGGEVASSTITRQLSKFIENSFPAVIYDPDAMLKIASEIDEINKSILKQGSENTGLKGMGATLSFLLVLENKVGYINVGDSRIYQVRDDKIQQLSEDDSVVNDLFRNGMISSSERRLHPLKNIITKAIGTDAGLSVKPQYADFLKNDLFILCSDGLSDMIEDDEILETVLKHRNTGRICKELINKANKYGGRDNITVVVCKI